MTTDNEQMASGVSGEPVKKRRGRPPKALKEKMAAEAASSAPAPAPVSAPAPAPVAEAPVFLPPSHYQVKAEPAAPAPVASGAARPSAENREDGVAGTSGNWEDRRHGRLGGRFGNRRGRWNANGSAFGENAQTAPEAPQASPTVAGGEAPEGADMAQQDNAGPAGQPPQAGRNGRWSGRWSERWQRNGGNGGRREFVRRPGMPSIPQAGQNPDAYTSGAASAPVSSGMGDSAEGMMGGKHGRFRNGRKGRQNAGFSPMPRNNGKEERRNPRVNVNPRELELVSEADRQRLALGADAKKIDVAVILQTTTEELNALAASVNVEGMEFRSRQEVTMDILRAYAADSMNLLKVRGVLDLQTDGSGFLRYLHNSYTPSQADVYVTAWQVRRMNLRTGDELEGSIRQPRENECFLSILNIETVNGDDPSVKKHITPFEQLVPYFPTQRFFLERGPEELSMRVVDLVTPIGRGQRGLIVAGPRSGKTVVMQKIANSILANNPDVELIVLLIDERPEEVTDMKKEVKAEVVSSTFDQSPERHAQVAEMVIEKAKRKVEHGKHVVILLDSITRLARAYNTLQPHSGRILSGGVDANALQKPKRFFGAARNIQGGGSLTILATALVDTGSKMDEVIFEEFKGTGNMELHLDQKLVERRLYPAIDVAQSGTRREDLLVNPDELVRLWALRRAFCALSSTDAMEELLKRLKKYPTNVEFLMSLNMPKDE